MFLRHFIGSASFYSNRFVNHIVSKRNLAQCRHCFGLSSIFNRNGNQLDREIKLFYTKCFLPIHKKCYSKDLTQDDLSSLKFIQENDLKKISELFPQPRVTLYELSTRTPDKVFDIHFKQNVVTPKSRKKKIQDKDWTCTYAFVWPEQMKFESTAISKRQAAEKAATLALQYLYTKKRIDSKGRPIYDKVVLEDLRSKLNEPLTASISENAVDSIERIWNDYENGIKQIYEATFEEAKRELNSLPAVLTKDSTIDEEDDYSETEIESDDETTDLSEQKVRVHPVYGKPLSPPSETTLQRRDRALQRTFDRYTEELTPLPIDEYAKEITSALEKSRVVVIVGAAGCGKSTRAPAAILRQCGAATAAVVSEPRRVAAIGLAERVADEMGERVGESVGYQVRLHAKPPRPPGGSILYCTSGVLLRRLQSNPGLEGCTHVFIDEAHERDVNTDITLLLLKRALNLNPKLKVVVMSATLDIDVFTKYFDSCPIVEVPGRTYPVQVSHLEDIQTKYRLHLPYTMENCQREDGKPLINSQEVVDVIKAVDRMEPEGAILVFLPGWAEIKLTKKLLDEHYPHQSTHLILPVHSRLSTTDQAKMFAKPNLGVRKIVLATNVAETSITIPDVVHVIDTGAHKENRIREGTATASLETVWVSRASAKQRTGRAGRVQPGHCYRMYTKEKEAEFAPHTTPEILRIPLDQTALDCKTYAPEDKIEDFLSQLPEPPSKKAIQFAINDLIDLGALSPSERLTRLGRALGALPLAPRAACALLHAATAGALLPAAHGAAHATAAVELFRDAPDRRPEIRAIKRQYSKTSDYAALHWIQMEFEEVLATEGWQGVDQWCDKYGLRKDRLNFIKSLSNLHVTQLLKSGIIEPTVEVEDLNRFSDVDELTDALILSGSNALLRTRKLVRAKGKLNTAVELVTSVGDRAHIGSESVAHGVAQRHPRALLAHCGGQHSAQRRALVVYRCALLPPHAALLCSMGRLTVTNVSDGDTTVFGLPRHKLQIHVPTSQAVAIQKAREMLWSTFQYYIERDLMTLSYDDNTAVSKFKVTLMKTIGRILVEAMKEQDQQIEDVR